MKKILLVLTTIIYSISLFAQTPQKMSYQAIIRSSNNSLITNREISLRISILQDSITGKAVYIETHTPTTNSSGLITLEIGGGTVILGVFSSIKWETGKYFIKTETDPTGGINYSISGSSQLFSVPYALYSEKSRAVSDALTLIYTTTGF